MKVLQTISGLTAKSGGPSTCTRDLLGSLSSISSPDGKECKVDLLTVANPGNLGKGASWLKEVENDYTEPFFFSENARKFMRENDYDLYHCNALWMGINHDTCKVAREKGKPYIISSHGMLYPTALKVHAWKKWILLNTWYKKDILNATCLHATCMQEAEHCRAFGYKGPIAVIPNPVVIPEEAAPQTSPKREGTKRTIGFLGRLHPIKKVENVLYAMALIRDEGLAINDLLSFQIMGKYDDKYEHWLKEEVKRLGLEDCVEFVGFVSGKDKYKRLQNLSALMVPSVQENFGMIVPEALICGTPVYASLGTPWGELSEYDCGWWEDNKVETIVKVIKGILSLSEKKLHEKGLNGRRLIEEKYEQHSVAAMMQQLYYWILDDDLAPNNKPDFVYLPEEVPLKVLTFITGIDLAGGGPSRSVPMLVKGLAEENVDITLMTFRTPNMNTHALDGTTAKLKIWDKHTSMRKIEKYIVEEGFNLIQMQSLWSWSYHQVAQIARKHNIPYIITPRGMLEPWSLSQKKWKKKFGLQLYQMNDLQKAACIFTTADMEAQHVRELGVKAPISVIPNGIETEGYPCRTSMEGVKKQILFLSRIHKKKGIEILIEAFSHLHGEFKDWNVVVVGNGEQNYIESLGLKVKNLGLEDRIKILPPVYGKDKVKLYQESSIFCLPSYSENFGMVIAEAMSCGVPVITTTNCPWDFLNATKTGWSIELSTGNLEQALREAMSMKSEERYEMGQRSSQLINDTFNYHSVARKTKEMFERTVHKKQKV